VFKRADLAVQTTGFYFRHELVIYKGKITVPIVWSPADFVDREALLEGRAVSRYRKAYIDGDGWRLLVNPAATWPKEFEGKTAEGMGTVKKGDGEYWLNRGTTRLVKLNDQLGMQVALRGRAWSLNGHWWFEYRGTKLYVEDMKDLPGWKGDLHGASLLITGVLGEANLPDLDQIGLKPDRDLKKYFIVRKAGWKLLNALLAPERGNE
jgi:hypothetical protein